MVLGSRPQAFPMDPEMFTDVMVDLETTGTQPDRTGILQIAAVRFNLLTGEVDENFFDECLMLPPNRFWAEDTRYWWSNQKPGVLAKILARGRPPGEVMQEFVDFCRPVNHLRFWSKPVTFDFPFLSSYCRDFGFPMPFSFREATDMNTFIRSRFHPNPIPDLDVPFEGDEHNALFDSLHQIGMVLEAVRVSSQEIQARVET